MGENGYNPPYRPGGSRRFRRFPLRALPDQIPLYRIIGGVADEALDVAGVGDGGLLVDADVHEVAGDEHVALVNVLGEYQAAFGELDAAAGAAFDEAALFQGVDGAADGGPCDAHVFADVLAADYVRFQR